MAWGGRNKKYGSDRYSMWAPYVPVAERKRQATKKIAAMSKKGVKASPVIIEGRSIASTFWGKAWCDNLESYSDYENRLPRGRTYVRNGSVVDLKITPGKVQALVSGSSLYSVEIGITPLDGTRWKNVINRCTGKIDSLINLLQGKISQGVMVAVTSKEIGLFPTAQQITLKCSCPDWATMCKHIAATLYGVGSRLDHEPETLFLLRGVNHLELIAKAAKTVSINRKSVASEMALNTEDLGSLFGIEIDTDSVQVPASTKILKNKAISTKKKIVTKKATLPRPKLKAAKPKKMKKNLKKKSLKATTANTNRRPRVKNSVALPTTVMP